MVNREDSSLASKICLRPIVMYSIILSSTFNHWAFGDYLAMVGFSQMPVKMLLINTQGMVKDNHDRLSQLSYGALLWPSCVGHVAHSQQTILAHKLLSDSSIFIILSRLPVCAKEVSLILKSYRGTHIQSPFETYTNREQEINILMQPAHGPYKCQ